MSRSKIALAAVVFLGCADLTQPPAPAQFAGKARFALSAAPSEVVLPSGYASVMGEENNSFPHTQRNLRYQQVFLGSDLADPIIVGVCLRRDEAFGGASSTQTLTIKLGPTSLDYTNLGSVFADNYSASPTEVFSGEVVIPASSGSGTPADFDFCIPFTQSYSHPALSNLIIEVVNTSLIASTGQPRDACSESGAACTTARAVALSASALPVRLPRAMLRNQTAVPSAMRAPIARTGSPTPFFGSTMITSASRWARSPRWGWCASG